MEGWGGGQSWESIKRRFTIYSIFLDMKKSIFYIKKSIPFLDIRTSFFDLKKSISWYQKSILDIKKLEWFSYIKDSDWFFYIIDFFFHIKKWICFLYQKSIFDITKCRSRMNSKTASQRTVLLFIRWFFLILHIKNINLSFWYKISARFFNYEFYFLFYKLFFYWKN